MKKHAFVSTAAAILGGHVLLGICAALIVIAAVALVGFGIGYGGARLFSYCKSKIACENNNPAPLNGVTITLN